MTVTTATRTGLPLLLATLVLLSTHGSAKQIQHTSSSSSYVQGFRSRWNLFPTSQRQQDQQRARLPEHEAPLGSDQAQSTRGGSATGSPNGEADHASVQAMEATGGGIHNRNRNRNPAPPLTGLSIAGIPYQTLLKTGIPLAVICALLIRYREQLKPLTDRHYIQEHALTLLRDLQEKPHALLMYILGMALWEFCGLSTIPVETAAGMVFGFQKGFLASGFGKMMGAYTAFGLGRGLLSQLVQTKLNENPVWSVINQSTTVHSPFQVAMLMKFSCFPELFKNFGSSCLVDISFWTFCLATALHGLFFTALWTYLGVDAAARLENALLPSNIALQCSLVVAALIGLVGSPLLMAWWIRDMKQRATAPTTRKNKRQ